jgi:hypothetical protein
MQVAAGFDMDGEVRAASLDKRRQECIRLFNHEMDIQGQTGDRRYGTDNRWTDSEVRHEVPIHDIHMQQVCSSGFHTGDLVSKTYKIGCQDGGRDFYHG